MQPGLEVGDIVTFESEHDGYPPETPFAVALVPLTSEQRERFEEWKRENGEPLPRLFVGKEVEA